MKIDRKLRLIIAALAFGLTMVIEHLFRVKIVHIVLSGAVYIFIGYDVLWSAVKNIRRGHVLDENFLMTIASLGAFIAGEFSEAVAVMLFYQVGEYFQDYAVGKSRRQISDLMDIKPEKAVVIRDGEEETVEPDEVEIGEVLVVRNGEKIPLDGKLLSDVAMLDTSALTGESMPVNLKKGDSVLSGSINTGGVIRIEAEKEYYDSTVSKILDMVESVAGKKSKYEKFITKFAKYYTPIVVIAAVLLAVVPSLITCEWSAWNGAVGFFENLINTIASGNWGEWVMRALTFLVVSCPCALVISVPLSFFGGIGGASKKGILVKGGNYLELIGKTDTFVFDKTGTLTKGAFSITEIFPKERENEVLEKAAVAENGSNHPISKSIVSFAKDKGIGFLAEGYEINEVAGKGIRAEKDGEEILCGNKALMEENNVDFVECKKPGSVVYVAVNGKYFGYILIADTVKSEAADVIAELRRQGCKTVMLTGDNEEIAAEIAKQTGVDEYKSQMLPSDKVEFVDNLITNKDKNNVIAFVGDGINDAPVIMRADVGVSMGGVGSDSAIEASDMVLMYDDLNAIITARKVSVKTMRVVRQNIIFALAVKFGVLILSAFGFANMWLAVFADVGVAVLAILNAMRCLKVK